MPSELYTDQREHGHQGPSRTVLHLRACTVGGGTFAGSQDGSRCVVAGKDVLRILRISSNGSSQKSQIQTSFAFDGGHRVYSGPGGATIGAGSNLWTPSGLKMDSAPTDVVWARGGFENKIVTSARNGEIIYWDINKSGSKFETRIKEHKRAVNKLAISPFLPHLIASGSQDGYLRIWDLRTPPASSMKVYHATGIRAVALCPVPSNPLTICTGLESGNIQRWDIRNKASPLERISLAHSSSILSMDWQLPNPRQMGLGWLVTSGMDRRVKVWDLTLPPGTSLPHNSVDKDSLFLNKRMGPRPFRTLHTAFPVRNVCWRPGYECEVAVVSNNESESETVEIWDIRRGWIAKWALEGAEGGITDISFASSHTLWAQHANGTFAQHDLRESFRPLDAIPRVAMSWSVSGHLAFVSNKQPAVEVPYDDIDPLKKPLMNELRVRHKSTSDPPYVPSQQTLGVQSIPLVDRSVFVRLAKSYVFNGDKRWLCQMNGEIASEYGQYHAAQTWFLLSSQLTILQEPSLSPSVSSMTHAPKKDFPRPSGSPVTKSLGSVSVSEAPDDSKLSFPSSRKFIETRSSSEAVQLPLDAPRSLHGQDTPPSSASSSPGPRTGTLFHESLSRPPGGLTPSRPSYHESSLVSPRNAPFRRATTILPMTPSPRALPRRASMSTRGAGTSSEGTRSHKHTNVGEGALDDSDSGSSSEGSVPEQVVNTKRVHPSPLSNSVVSRDASPDGHLAGDERSLNEYDSDASHSPRSTSSSEGSVQSDYRVLLKQESQGSIRTVTESPMGRPSVMGDEGTSTRRPSSTSRPVQGPPARRPSPSPGLGLGLSNMSEEQPKDRLSEACLREVLETEARIREIGWQSLRNVLEYFAENGDVQMCALLAIVVPEELGIGASRGAQFIEAYIELLTRLELHTTAAEIRKFSNYSSVRDATQVQTTLFASCGQCRKPIKTGTICLECRGLPTLCAVCHLPTRSLLLHCAICGHSAHVACLHSFYLTRPLTPLAPRAAHGGDGSGSGSGSGSMSTVYYSVGEETETETEDGTEPPNERVRNEMRLFGRACAAGCGHYCWAAAKPPLTH